MKPDRSRANKSGQIHLLTTARALEARRQSVVGNETESVQHRHGGVEPLGHFRDIGNQGDGRLGKIHREKDSAERHNTNCKLVAPLLLSIVSPTSAGRMNTIWRSAMRAK